MQEATNARNDNTERGRLSDWSLGIGAVASLTMFFNPLSVVGATALVPA